MGFDEVSKSWDWKPIRNCPGRFVLRAGRGNLRPEEIIGREVKVVEFQASTARDVVSVARLDRGGLISYRRRDGSFVHTLNTEEGFERKLRELRIDLKLF